MTIFPFRNPFFIAKFMQRDSTRLKSAIEPSRKSWNKGDTYPGIPPLYNVYQLLQGKKKIVGGRKKLPDFPILDLFGITFFLSQFASGG
jgi:hypothetical protein